jgi:hypothetical protein
MYTLGGGGRGKDWEWEGYVRHSASLHSGHFPL